jgi:hypothetical protein
MEYHNPKPSSPPFSKLEITLALFLLIPSLVWLLVVFVWNGLFLLCECFKEKTND